MLFWPLTNFGTWYLPHPTRTNVREEPQTRFYVQHHGLRVFLKHGRLIFIFTLGYTTHRDCKGSK
jgi:hypothetical protein